VFEPSFADVYYSRHYQEYALILDEYSAFHYAEQALIDEHRLELRTMPYADYLRTPEWAGVAARAKAQAGYRCMFCNSPGELHAHHRTYERRGAELEEDVVALCADCHRRLHGL
jgi:5-methylcytosine-specific restriction endonuclease McrA